ncbi:MAG: hypothetical protein JW795_18740 [Chitinivibrionales bacterium]|nr:hypothetical protein [Chitinivibrionales bacterium]
MKKSSKLSVFILSLTCVWVIGTWDAPQARDLIASVAEIPLLADSPEKGAFIDYIKALDEIYTDGKIVITLYPWPRSIDNVINKRADFHIPIISNPNVNMDTVPYRFASKPMGVVSVVIFSNINKEITREMVDKAMNVKPFPYKIELTRGTETFYAFPTSQSVEVEPSFKKLGMGRIDAFLIAQEDGDMVLKKLKIKNLKRNLFENKDDLIAIQKGPSGDEVDKILTDLITKLDQSGKSAKLREKVHIPYVDWQPATMGW